MKISVCCPSYKRPLVETLRYLPYVKVYVAENEYDFYLKANKGFEDNIICCPNEQQGNISRIRNYMLDCELKDNDAVLIIDDDLSAIGYWEGLNEKGKKVEHILTADELLDFLQTGTQMAKDIGAYLWGLNIAPDPQNYRTYTPFSTTSFLGAPFHCTLKGSEPRYDETMPLKEDYDMTLQQLNQYRVVLRFNKYFYKAKQSSQTGGCAVYRNRKTEEHQLGLLQKKWGKKIVKIDSSDKSNKLKKVKKHMDYNPIIHVPIRGV